MKEVKVFIGSSDKSQGIAREIATWLEAAGVTPVPWYGQGLVFKPGDTTLTALEKVASEVQGAVFVFAEDDTLDEGKGHVVRGNVVFESGLFIAKLSLGRVAICRVGNPKPVSNLAGVCWINLSEPNKNTAIDGIKQWACDLSGKPKIDSPGPPIYSPQFPLEEFKRGLAEARQLRILQTFIPIREHLDEFRGELVAALRRGCEAEILLCKPESLVCKIRQWSLDPGTDVNHLVTETFSALQKIAKDLPETSRARLKIRAYETLPSMSIYQVDSVIFFGHYYHGGKAICGPHLRVEGKSDYATHLNDEFGKVWSHVRTWKYIDPSNIDRSLRSLRAQDQDIKKRQRASGDIERSLSL